MARKETIKDQTISTEEVAALKKAVEEAELKVKALNTLIDTTEEQFNISIRKNPGDKQKKSD